MLAPNRLPLAPLTILSATAMLILVTELMPVGLLAPMSGSLGVSEGQVGFLATAYAGAATVAAIPLSARTRRISRRPLLMGLLLGFALANLVTALSSSYGVTVAARVALGLLGGVTWSILPGYAAGLAPARLRGRAVAIAVSGVTVALSVGLPAGTALAGRIGWRGTFGVLTAGAVVLAVVVAFGVPALPGERRPARDNDGQSTGAAGLPSVLRLPGVVQVLLVTTVLLVGHQATYTYLAPIGRRAGLDRPGLTLLVFGAATAGGVAITAVLVDRHLRALTTTALGLVTVSLFALAVDGSQAGVLLTAVAVWGLAFGGLPTALLTGLIRSAGERNATTAGSLQATVYNVGVASGSLVGGLVLDRAGAAALPWLASGLVALATVLTLGRARGFGP